VFALYIDTSLELILRKALSVLFCEFLILLINDLAINDLLINDLLINDLLINDYAHSMFYFSCLDKLID